MTNYEKLIKAAQAKGKSREEIKSILKNLGENASIAQQHIDAVLGPEPKQQAQKQHTSRKKPYVPLQPPKPIKPDPDAEEPAPKKPGILKEAFQDAMAMELSKYGTLGQAAARRYFGKNYRLGKKGQLKLEKEGKTKGGKSSDSTEAGKKPGIFKEALTDATAMELSKYGTLGQAFARRLKGKKGKKGKVKDVDDPDTPEVEVEVKEKRGVTKTISTALLIRGLFSVARSFNNMTSRVGAALEEAAKHAHNIRKHGEVDKRDPANSWLEKFIKPGATGGILGGLAGGIVGGIAGSLMSGGSRDDKPQVPINDLKVEAKDLTYKADVIEFDGEIKWSRNRVPVASGGSAGGSGLSTEGGSGGGTAPQGDLGDVGTMQQAAGSGDLGDLSTLETPQGVIPSDKPSISGGRTQAPNMTPGGGTQAPNMTPAMKGVLDGIAEGESGAKGYGAINYMAGGGTVKDFSRHPFEGRKGYTAAGRYQILASNWEKYAKRLGIKDFSPESQDRVAAAFAADVYRQKTGRSLEEDAKNPETHGRIAQVLAPTWHALHGAGGGKFVSRLRKSMAAYKEAEKKQQKEIAKTEKAQEQSALRPGETKAERPGEVKPETPGEIKPETPGEIKPERKDDQIWAEQMRKRAQKPGESNDDYIARQRRRMHDITRQTEDEILGKGFERTPSNVPPPPMIEPPPAPPPAAPSVTVAPPTTSTEGAKSEKRWEESILPTFKKDHWADLPGFDFSDGQIGIGAALAILINSSIIGAIIWQASSMFGMTGSISGFI